MTNTHPNPDGKPEFATGEHVIDVHEAFDRVHDSSGNTVIVDSSKAALAVFVTFDGKVQLKSPYSKRQVAAMLRQIADQTDARAEREEERDVAEGKTQP